MNNARIRLETSNEGVVRVRRTLAVRLKAEFRPGALRGVSRALRRDAALFWSERAWSEYAAMPVMAQALRAGVAERVPLDDSAAVAGILQDEALHTELSRDVANTFHGYVEKVPAHLGFAPYELAVPLDLPLAHWLVAGGCVGETISRALIQARLRHTRVPWVRAVVMRTLKDENVHVAYSWAALKRVVSPLSRVQKKRLAEFCLPTVEGAFSSQCTGGLRGPARRQERGLRQRVADAGLGSCPPDEEDEVVRHVLERVIAPALQGVGLPL